MKNIIKLTLAALVSTAFIYAKAVPASAYNSVTQGSGVKVVYLWAPWCGNCAAFKPIYNSVKRKFSNSVQFYEINGDPVNDPFTTFGLKYGYPAVQIFKNGVKLDSREGGMSQEELIAWIKQYK